MKKLMCRKSYSEDNYELFTEGKIYEIESEDKDGLYIRTNLGDTGNLLWDDASNYFQGVCTECERTLDEDEPVCVIDIRMESERVVCETCCSALWKNGRIVQCESCGSYYTTKSLPNKKIKGGIFTECPCCHRDIVNGMTQEEFEKEYAPMRFTAVVRFLCGEQRGYIVWAKDRKEAMKKLIKKSDVTAVHEITIAEVLLDEDEICEDEAL